MPHANAGPTSSLLISMVFYNWQCSISYSVEEAVVQKSAITLFELEGVLRSLTFFRTVDRNSIPTMHFHVHVEPAWKTQAEQWL